MDKKIIFLDIDGTLVADDGWVPASAADACRQARLNGHEIYLCTGRSKPEIYDFIMEIGFDGIIGAGGGFIELNDGMLYHKTVPDSEVSRMVDSLISMVLTFTWSQTAACSPASISCRMWNAAFMVIWTTIRMPDNARKSIRILSSRD